MDTYFLECVTPVPEPIRLATDILRHETLVLTQAAARQLESSLKGGAEGNE